MKWLQIPKTKSSLTQDNKSDIIESTTINLDFEAFQDHSKSNSVSGRKTNEVIKLKKKQDNDVAHSRKLSSKLASSVMSSTWEQREITKQKKVIYKKKSGIKSEDTSKQKDNN